MGFNAVGVLRHKIAHFRFPFSNQGILVTRQKPLQNACPVRCCSDREEDRKQLGGYVYKDEIQPFESRWRSPYTERKSLWKSRFSLFTSNSFQADRTKLNPSNLKLFSFKQWWFYHKREKLVYNQQFIEKRLNILGCDLAAAHFVVYRGGAVKFCNQTEWIRDDKSRNKEYDDDLPSTFDADYVLEAIDFSKTPILYEGLKNIENLTKVKWLSFEYCSFFDNWCLDKICGDFQDSLEYLNISHTNTTWHALNAVYKLKHLKRLKIENWSEDPKFFMMCAEIKKSCPELVIEGVPKDLLDEVMESNIYSECSGHEDEERILSKDKV